MKFMRLLMFGTVMLMANGAAAQNSAKPFQLDEATISDVHAAYKSGALTSVKLVQAYRERIRACDQAGPKLNVVIFLNPRALEEAAALYEHFRKTGKFVGPLHGIPMLLKDNVDTKDMPTTGGSLSLAGYTPATDAAIAQKLRRAGAIILAKVNLHEFAIWGETVSSIQGQTRNPYDLTRTPGGSSGGTGAGVAANFAIAGIGTDSVNSIRSPASANSLVGIRPTLGLVSRAGIIPVSFTQDAAGPLARTVADAAVMLDVMAGYDPDDPVTALGIGRIPATYTVSLDRNGLKGTRIGVLRTLFGSGPDHQEVNRVTANALELLKQHGAILVDIDAAAFDTGKLNSDLDVQKYEYMSQLNNYLKTQRNPPMNSLAELIASGEYDTASLDKFLASAESYEDGLSEPDYKDRRVKIDD